MRDSGSVFGWLIIAGFSLTLMNYLIRAFYRFAIVHLPSESKVKRVYTRVQRVVVSNHRFFAFFTTVMLLAHVAIQLRYRWLSWTGLTAAAIMVANDALGGYGHYIKKKKRSAWFRAHRVTAVLLIASIIVHLITKR